MDGGESYLAQTLYDLGIGPRKIPDYNVSHEG